MALYYACKPNLSFHYLNMHVNYLALGLFCVHLLWAFIHAQLDKILGKYIL